MQAISSENGAMTAIRLGSASVVILISIHTSWPCEVTTLSWRRASATQTMLDSDNRMRSSADPACRKTYLSKIVMLTRCEQEGDGGMPAPGPSLTPSSHATVAEIRLFPNHLAAVARGTGGLLAG